MKKYRLLSDANVHTPGIVAWAMSGYHSIQDRPTLVGIFVNGYSLPEDVAHGLLSGEIPHTVEGDVVEIEVPGDAEVLQ